MCGVQYAKKSKTSAIWSLTGTRVSSCNLLLSDDGELSLIHDGVVVAWSSNTSGLGVVNMTLRDDGNLVLLDSKASVVWQSFQSFPSLCNLPSGRNFSGSDTLYERLPVPLSPDFCTPGDYALTLTPTTPQNRPRHLLLLLTSNMFVYHSFPISAAGVRLGDALEFYNDTGGIGGGGTKVVPPNAIPAGSSPPNSSFPIRSGYLENGNFYVNYWNGSYNVRIYNTSVDECFMPYTCGAFNLCSKISDGGIRCDCPEGFSAVVDTSNRSCTSSDKRYNMKPINVVFHPQYSSVAVHSRKDCAHLCSANATCRAALFDSSTLSCTLFSSVLYTLPRGSNDSQVMLIKVDAPNGLSAGAIAGCSIGAGALLLAVAALLILGLRRRRRKALERRDELFLADLPRLPPRFTYKELQAATGNFSKLLGRGGFGSVYEGLLGPTGVRVAVKRLDCGGGGGGGGGGGRSMDEFRAEVATIGSVSHVNLVRLRGFCMEGSVRMVVYEFMENGSLDKWLFGKQRREEEEATPPEEEEAGDGDVLEWETRCRIALDTARGLEYLHYGSAEHIVHCDVKPENILLGHGFHAKVSDFGLARLLGADDGFAMTTLKGTRGYLAPEWLRETTVTVKSDVYSFGVVLLELITGRRCLDSESDYLPIWAARVAAAPSTRPLQEMVLDRKLAEKEAVSEEALERLFALALACIQADSAKRPPMTTVVEVLEEDVVGIQKKEGAAAPARLSGIMNEYDEEEELEERGLLKAAMGRRKRVVLSEVVSEEGRYPSEGLVLPPR